MTDKNSPSMKLAQVESTMPSKPHANLENKANVVITAEQMQNLAQIVDKSVIRMPLVAVYCGSRLGNQPEYAAAATELGHALANNDMGLVYGGASIGLMGVVADAVLAGGADAVGVIPNFMLDREVAHNGLVTLHLTDTMHTRKAIMAEYADAFLTLPGGLGTLEEVMEVATWRQLYQHQKPIIILNIKGYYDRLIEHLEFSVQEGFISPEDLDKLIICDDVASAIDVLKQTVAIEDNMTIDKL